MEARSGLENCQPILRVEDMAVSLRFYVDLLGFVPTAWSTSDFSSISRDRAGLYLCQRGQGQGRAWIWVGANDVQALHREFVAKGVAIRLAPTNFPWALEMHIEDPDGNVIRFGSDMLDEPFSEPEF